MNEQKSQSGFAHLIIFVILSIVLVGSLGFVYWRKVNNADANVSNEKNVSTAATEDDSNSACDDDRTVDDWTKLETDYYTIPIPDGWNLKEQKDGPVYSEYRYDNDKVGSLTYCNGAPAAITAADDFLTPDVNFRITIKQQENARTINDSSYSSYYEQLGYQILDPIYTKDGKTVNRYYRYYDKKPTSSYSNTQIVDGTRYYYYEIYVGGSDVMRILYCIIPGQPDNLAQLNQAVQNTVLNHTN